MSANKGKPIFGLEKIPIEALLKLSRIEIGKLKAHIDELEYEKEKLERKLKNFTSLPVKEQKRIKERIFTESEYKKQRTEIQKLYIKVNNLEKDLEREICRRIQLEKSK